MGIDIHFAKVDDSWCPQIKIISIAKPNDTTPRKDRCSDVHGGT